VREPEEALRSIGVRSDDLRVVESIAEDVYILVVYAMGV